MTSIPWGERALSYAQTITKTGRGSATRAETEAAETVRQQLARLGVTDVRTQPFDGQRSDYLFLALAFGFVLLGHAAYWLLRAPFGVWVEIILSTLAFGFGGYLLWRKYTYRRFPFQEALPHGPSQNVLAVLPPAAETRRRIVFVGHLDSHRAAWWYATDALTVFYLLSTPAVMAGIILSPALYALAGLAHLPALAWAALPFAALHFIAWFTGVTADLGPYSPGANDNASAVGTLLALAERLREEPLQHTEVWLAFTGCEETGAEGMSALLDEYGETLREALFVDFEMVGIGDELVYLQAEGIVRRKRISPEVERLLREAAPPDSLHPLGIAGLGALTEMGVVLERGLKGVCILGRQSGKRLFPEWHRLTDTASRLQPESLARAHALGWAILQKIEDGQL